MKHEIRNVAVFKNNDSSCGVKLETSRPSLNVDSTLSHTEQPWWYSGCVLDPNAGDQGLNPYTIFVRGCGVAFVRPRDITVQSWEVERGICINISNKYNHTLIYIFLFKERCEIPVMIRVYLSGEIEVT